MHFEVPVPAHDSYDAPVLLLDVGESGISFLHNGGSPGAEHTGLRHRRRRTVREARVAASRGFGVDR
jgi:hypothetical protein